MSEEKPEEIGPIVAYNMDNSTTYIGVFAGTDHQQVLSRAILVGTKTADNSFEYRPMRELAEAYWFAMQNEDNLSANETVLISSRIVAVHEIADSLEKLIESVEKKD